MVDTDARRGLRRIRFRLRLAFFGRDFLRWLSFLLVLHAAAMVLCRACGVGVDFFPFWSFLLDPVVASAVALCRRVPTLFEAAHWTDQRLGSGDVFLTFLHLDDGSEQGYAPLVRRQAAEWMSRVDPRRVAPLAWGNGMRRAGVVVALVAVAFFFFPTLDPFGHREKRQEIAAEKDRLRTWRKLAEARRAELTKAGSREQHSPQAKREITALEQVFRTAAKGKKQQTMARLNERQKALGALWRERNRERLRRAFQRASAAQHLGGSGGLKKEAWLRDLGKGEATALRREIEAVRELVKRMEKSRDTAERERLEREAMQRLRALSRFAENEMGDGELANLLNEAMAQLATMKLGDLGREAEKSLLASLDLSQAEIEALAQRLRDAKTLEEALGVCQMAKAANMRLKEGLDGAACAQCQGLKAYAELYAKLAGRAGTGAGMKGAGHGQGGMAPEDPTRTTSFKPERSPTTLAGGRMLSQWKVREMGPKGVAREAYAASPKEVRQAVNEAILRERIPPGYHDAIRRYFSTLEE